MGQSEFALHQNGCERRLAIPPQDIEMNPQFSVMGLGLILGTKKKKTL